MADFDHFDDRDHNYRRSQGFIDHSGHKQERVRQILQNRGKNLGIDQSPEAQKLADEQARESTADYLKRHDDAFIEPGDKARAKRLGVPFTCGDDEGRPD